MRWEGITETVRARSDRIALLRSIPFPHHNFDSLYALLPNYDFHSADGVGRGKAATESFIDAIIIAEPRTWLKVIILPTMTAATGDRDGSETTLSDANASATASTAVPPLAPSGAEYGAPFHLNKFNKSFLLHLLWHKRAEI